MIYSKPVMTLTEAARLTRKVAFWGALTISLLIFIRVSVGIGVGIYQQFFPKPAPPPNVAFGKLTPYDFSQNIATSSGGVSYVIQTIQGDLPNLGDRAKVFKVNQQPPSILFGEEARRQAKALRFAPEPQVVTERIYNFLDPNLPGRKLELDVFSGNFKITNDLNLHPELLGMEGKLDPATAVRIANGFLNGNNLFQKDFSEEKITVNPLKIESGKLINARSLRESHVVRVGFGRADLEKVPILPVDSDKPNVWIEVTPLTDSVKQIFQVSYFYHPADLSTSATYPLKPTKAAFEELAGGGGVLVGEKLPQLEIRKVYLAYLETVAPMNFFAPFYVFAGDNFMAFVLAVPSEFVGL